MAVNFKFQITEIPPQEGYVKVSSERLVTGVALPFNVYVKDNGVIKKIFNKGNILNDVFIQILREKGFDEVYINKTEIKNLEFYLTKKREKRKDYDVKVAFKNYSFFKEKHFQIDRRLIIPNIKVNFSIYLLQGLELKKIVDASIDNPLIIDDKILSMEGDFLIEDRDIPLYEEYVNSLPELLGSCELTQEDNRTLKNLILKENSKVIMKELLKDPRSGGKIKKIGNLVDDIAVQIMNDPQSIYSLIMLKGHDYYTYTHSVNVAVLSIGLALHLGMSKDFVHKLGMGAILHDIGKTKISHEILNKQGRLTEDEYKTIKQHVLFGYEIVKEQKDFPVESFEAILQHHEKLTGEGYPFGLKGEEITIYGRITAIADCYDALTTRRPYKAPLTPFFSLSVLTREKKDYDKDILKEFIKMLGNVR